MKKLTREQLIADLTEPHEGVASADQDIFDADELNEWETARLERFRVTTKRKPTMMEGEETLAFLVDLEDRNPFYIGDLWNILVEAHGESAGQALDPDHFSLETLKNYAWVATNIPPTKRLTDVAHNIHSAVAALPPAKRDELLHEAKEE